MKNKVLITVMLILVYIFNFLGTSGELGTSQSLLGELFPFPYMPPGTTFMIAWGLIYLSLLIYLIHVWKHHNTDKAFQNIGPLFVASCMLNILWMVATSQERWIISIALIFALWGILWKILDTIHLDHSDEPGENSHRLLGLKIPFGLYYGWISMASMTVGISQFIYQFNPEFTLTQARSYIIIAIGLLVTLFSRLRRRNIGQLLISFWAIAGILFALFGGL